MGPRLRPTKMSFDNGNYCTSTSNNNYNTAMCGTSVPAQFESLHLLALIDLWPANWLLQWPTAYYHQCNWDMKWLNHWNDPLIKECCCSSRIGHFHHLHLVKLARFWPIKPLNLWQHPHCQTDLMVSRCTLLKASPEAMFSFFASAVDDGGHNEWQNGHWLYAQRSNSLFACPKRAARNDWLAGRLVFAGVWRARRAYNESITSGRLDRAVMYAK